MLPTSGNKLSFALSDDLLMLKIDFLLNEEPSKSEKQHTAYSLHVNFKFKTHTIDYTCYPIKIT